MIKRACLTCAYRDDGCCRLAYDPLSGELAGIDVARRAVQEVPVREGFIWCGIPGRNWAPSESIDMLADESCKYDLSVAEESARRIAEQGDASLLEVETIEFVDDARAVAAKRLEGRGSKLTMAAVPSETPPLDAKKKIVGRQKKQAT